MKNEVGNYGKKTFVLGTSGLGAQFPADQKGPNISNNTVHHHCKISSKKAALLEHNDTIISFIVMLWLKSTSITTIIFIIFFHQPAGRAGTPSSLKQEV